MPAKKNITITTNQPVPPSVMTETTVIKKKKGWLRHPIRNTTGCLISLLGLGVIVFFVTSLIFMGLWIRTWSVFTQERTVGYVTVSALKVDSSGNKTFSLTYEGLDQEAAFGRFFPWGDKQIKKEKFTVDNLQGDSFRVYTSFFKWKDWLTFLGTPPLYKISSIRSDYYYSNEFNQNNSNLRAIAVNGGEDEFWRSVMEGKSFWNFGANATYISSPGQLVTNKDKKFAIVVTEDSMILQEVPNV
ncbi:MAG: hypothetical protein WCJ19_00530 [bacterium]